MILSCYGESLALNHAPIGNLLFSMQKDVNSTVRRQIQRMEETRQGVSEKRWNGKRYRWDRRVIVA